MNIRPARVIILFAVVLGVGIFLGYIIFTPPSPEAIRARENRQMEIKLAVRDFMAGMPIDPMKIGCNEGTDLSNLSPWLKMLVSEKTITEEEKDAIMRHRVRWVRE